MDKEDAINFEEKRSEKNFNIFLGKFNKNREQEQSERQGWMQQNNISETVNSNDPIQDHIERYGEVTSLDKFFESSGEPGGFSTISVSFDERQNVTLHQPTEESFNRIFQSLKNVENK
ncbi:hypothetical protein [Tolypothrix sp. VBCCA 56010]|uniref:hypothetical protein n=1 Tax=Tolypothrix sp. VBCCA 56010 TaxID=3137731 RepID=UPI003D7CA5BA